MVRNFAEAELQKKCVAWFRQTFPGVLLAYCNNNSSSARAGHRNKLLGTLPGMPDLFIYQRSGIYSGFAIEMKAPGKKATAGQVEIHEALAAQGFLVCVISSFETFCLLTSAYMRGAK